MNCKTVAEVVGGEFSAVCFSGLFYLVCSKSVQVRNKITVCVAFNIVWVAHYLTPNVDPKDCF